MGAEVDSLEVKIQASATKANKELDLLIVKLNKITGSLASVNMNGLSSMATGVQKLATSMQAMRNIKTADFSHLVKNVEKIGKINTTGLYRTTNAVRSITNTFNGIGTLANNAAQLGGVAGNISKLGNASAGKAVSNMPILANALKSFVQSMNGIGKIKFDITGLANLVGSISKLGGKTATNSIPNIKGLGIALKDMMRTLSTAPRVSQNVIQMTNALAKLAGQGTKVKTATSGLNSVLNRAGQSARNSAAHVSFFGNAVKNAQSPLKKLTTSLGKLYFKYLAIARIVRFVGSSIKKSMDFGETINLFQTAFKKIGTDSAAKSGMKMGTEAANEYATAFIDRAQAFNNKITSALSLDPNTMMNYQAVFASMANSMGLVSQSTENLSSAFTMLGADIASLFNTDISTAMEKLKAGMSGQIKPLRDLGVDISQASLQMTAYRYGIKDSVVKMGQAAKVQLRYLTIMEQTKVAWGDMAKTIDSPANQLRILQQQWSNLSRSIGSVFIPIVAKVLPYINALVIAFRKMMDALAGIMGFELPDYKDTAITGSSDALNDMEAGANKAAKANEKLKKTMLGIDEINQLSKPESDVAEKNTGGSGYAELDTAIADETAAYMEKFQEELDKMNNKAEQMADKIVGFFVKIKDASEPTIEAIKRFNVALEPFKSFVAQGLTDFYNNLLKPLGTWIMGEGLPRFFDITSSIFGEIDWGKLNISLADFWGSLTKLGAIVFTGLLDFYEILLKPIAKWTIGEGLPRFLDVLTEMVNNIDWGKLREALKEVWVAIEPFAINLGEGLLWFFENVLSPLTTWVLNDAVPVFLNLIAATLDVINRIIEVLKPLGQWLFDSFLKPLAEWTGGIIVDVIDSITEKLGVFGGWIKEHKGLVENLVVIIGSFAVALVAVKTACTVFEALQTGFAMLKAGQGIFSGLSAAIGFIASPVGIATVAIGALIAVGVLLYKNWDEIKAVANNVWKAVQEQFEKFKDFIKDVFEKDWRESFGVFGSVINSFLENIKNVWNGIKQIFTGVIDFVVGVFTGDWDKAWNGVVKVFKGIWDTLSSIVKAPINMILGVVEGLCNGIIDCFNWVKDMLNNIEITIPSWIPGIGGESWSPNLQQTEHVTIPRLADGGLISNTGQMFIANESGPELVGTYGNKSAVMNNDDIVKSVSTGVAAAIVPLLMDFASNSNRGSSDVPIYTTINISEEEIARAVSKGQRKIDGRYNVVSQTVY